MSECKLVTFVVTKLAIKITQYQHKTLKRELFELIRASRQSGTKDVTLQTKNNRNAKLNSSSNGSANFQSLGANEIKEWFIMKKVVAT